jgi:hypothetical protein
MTKKTNIEFTEDGTFVVIDGVRIAEIGDAAAGTWILLEPGYTVRGDPSNDDGWIIEHDCMRVH